MGSEGEAAILDVEDLIGKQQLLAGCFYDVRKPVDSV